MIWRCAALAYLGLKFGFWAAFGLIYFWVVYDLVCVVDYLNLFVVVCLCRVRVGYVTLPDHCLLVVWMSC